ncbi:WD40 repeat domain-containing serine/threonine protein kinase [Nonomuraea sp. bgisy101]|uniref:WD40 repeat domain-containing serine/threonine protein kinase n=1 Tax=Nonomuraea sp. bgisy101 TaxID=3413784 RepID=UPI003D75F520
MNGEPSRLGRYWLAGRLGAGGQGVVYEAYDEAANRVAVKVLHAYLSGDSTLRRRFLREVTAAQRVASFCTARIIGHDLEGERPYLVSEFVSGPSLRRAAPFSGDDLHRLALGVATALAAIHQAGVVHRDLKPENVLLGPDGPRVIDFGIARAAGLSMTSTGELTGTPMYMAPEVFDGGRAEPPADVFAWGALVCFAATGRDLFHAPTTVAVIHRLLTDEPDLSALPPALREPVAAALDKDPANRPTAHALLTTLLSGGRPLDHGGEQAPMAAAAHAAAAMRTPESLAGRPALGQVAEHFYASLPPHERDLARQLLLRLVDVREGEDSIRHAATEELVEGRPEAERLLAELERASLVERGAGTVSMGRAALLRAWPRLHEWVSGDREALSRHRRLGEAARRWAVHGRLPEDLLQGTALREVMTWAPQTPEHLTLNPTERAFVEASTAQAAGRARRRRLVGGGISVLLVTALIAGIVAWQQTRLSQASGRQLADKQTQERARLLAFQADALRKSDPARAMTLSVAAYRTADVPETRAAVLSSLAQPEQRMFKDPNLNNNGRALSADGSLLVSAGENEVRVYEVRTGRQTARLTGVGFGPFRAALSPDGDTLALAADSKLRLWSLRTGKQIATGTDKAWGSAFHANCTMRFSPGGRYLEVSANLGGPFSGLWDTKAGKFLYAGTGDLEVGPGDRYVVVGPTYEGDGKTTLVRDLPGGQARPMRASLPTLVSGASPVGRRVLVQEGGEARLWNLDTARPDPLGFKGTAATADFSADGKYMVTLSGLSGSGSIAPPPTVTLWRVADRAMLLRFTAASIAAQRPALSPDARRLTLLDDTGQATVYDLDRLTAPGPGAPAGSGSLWLAPDGRTAFSVLAGRVRSWQVPAFTPSGRMITPKVSVDAGLPKYMIAATVSPDGKTMVTTEPTWVGGPYTLWDTATGRRLAKIDITAATPRADNMERMVISPDGRRLAIAFSMSNDGHGAGSVLLVDLSRRAVTKVFNDISAGEMSFSPDGRWLTTGDPAGVDVIDLAGMTTLPVSAAPGTMAHDWMTYDGTGRRAVSPYGSRGVALWDATTWEPTGQLFKVAGDVLGAVFSPDGKTLAVAHDDRVTLFDLVSGRQLGSPQPVSATMDDVDLRDQMPKLVFMPSGDLRVLAHDGRVRDLPVSGERAAPLVCERAGGTLSRADWNSLVGKDVPYSDPCPKG